MWTRTNNNSDTEAIQGYVKLSPVRNRYFGGNEFGDVYGIYMDIHLEDRGSLKKILPKKIGNFLVQIVSSRNNGRREIQSLLSKENIPYLGIDDFMARCLIMLEDEQAIIDLAEKIINTELKNIMCEKAAESAQDTFAKQVSKKITFKIKVKK